MFIIQANQHYQLEIKKSEANFCLTFQYIRLLSVANFIINMLLDLKYLFLKFSSALGSDICPLCVQEYFVPKVIMVSILKYRK